MSSRFLTIVFVASCLLLAGANVWAQAGLNGQTTFNPGGLDSAQSLGQFEIVLNPAFSGAVAVQVALGNLAAYDPTQPDNGGYDPTTNRFWSPVLYDPSTLIGRSNAVEVGTNSSVSQVPVYSNATATTSYLSVGSNASGLTVSPSQPGSATYPYLPGYTAPAATTDAVMTNIQSMNLQGTGTGSNGGLIAVSLTAGTAAQDPNLPASLGRVTSVAGMGGSPQPNDFPANSYFDVYVDVSIPGLGTLTNATVGAVQGDPLIISSGTTISAFPPTVVYEHGNSTAVPILFENGPYQGDTLGLLLLAGHGMDYEDFDPPGVGTLSEFNAAIAGMTEMPVLPQYASWGPASDPLVVVPEPSTLALLTVGGIGLAGYCWRKRRKRQRTGT